MSHLDFPENWGVLFVVLTPKAFSALGETIGVKHKSRSWREVWMHLLSEKSTIVSCGPFGIPYHARSR